MTTIMVDPDDKHILSADEHDAFLLGRVDYKERCVFVPRSVYLAALSKWLDGKAKYREIYQGGFAGVGWITFDDAELQKDAHHYLNDFDEVDPDDESCEVRAVEVPTYRGEAFDIDMEHG
jgi:hypothetical protein